MKIKIELDISKLIAITKLIRKHIDSGHDEYCSIEFLDDGQIKVWANGIGFSTEKIE